MVLGLFCYIKIYYNEKNRIKCKPISPVLDRKSAGSFFKKYMQVKKQDKNAGDQYRQQKWSV